MTGGSELRVTFLGTGTSMGVPVPTCDCDVCASDDPRDRRLRPSVLVQWPGASVLIDSSTDLRTQALRHGIDRIDFFFEHDAKVSIFSCVLKLSARLV